MKNRWTQFEEDAYRLPEGMLRVGYDTDTQVYTFRDRNGTLYKGPPGADYGVLTPTTNIKIGFTRPGAFESDEQPNRPDVSLQTSPSTFQDILPPNLITATKSPIDNPIHVDVNPSHVHFVDAVRKTALPKMQGVVHNLRRSVTSVRHKNRPNEEGKKLLGDSTSDLRRSSSMATTRSSRSSVSALEPMAIKQ